LDPEEDVGLLERTRRLLLFLVVSEGLGMTDLLVEADADGVIGQNLASLNDKVRPEAERQANSFPVLISYTKHLSLDVTASIVEVQERSTHSFSE
jgi:hypothetical protein